MRCTPSPAALRSILRVGSVLALAAFVAVTGCDMQSEVLNKEPQDQLAETAVFKDPTLADSYILDAYDDLNFQQGYGFSTLMSWRWEHIGAEYVTGATWQWHYDMSLSVPDADGAYWAKNRWNFDNVRRANIIIKKLRNSNLEQDFIDSRVAEVRFIRAYTYYRMVKRYGGVPLITEVQTVDTPRDSVFVERSDEEKIWNFIANELDAAAENLPTDHDGREGRATKWAALGLKSRAMMYAASVAQFGEEKTAGSGENAVQLGMPTSAADQYWQEALSAAEAVINSDEFSLFNQYEDPAENYFRLFITEATANPEVILSEGFDGQEKGHSNTFQNLPMEYAKSWGANGGATWHTVQLFNYQDGSSGEISEAELERKKWTSEELFGNRDPRFKGAVLYPEAQFRDSTITFHSWTCMNGDITGQVDKFGCSGTKEDRESAGWIHGWPASAPPRNITRTGLLVRKRTRTDQRPNQHGTDPTDYIEMRLGEMYMNAAEAAFELGQMSKAKEYVNDIRERANMPKFSSVNREKIRSERQREMVLEQRRYWDLRRWRTAHEVIDGLRVKGMRFGYDFDTGKYDVRLVNAEGRERVFKERQYYLPLGSSRIADNPALVENPGY